MSEGSFMLFLVCVVGIYASFIPYGVVQEWVYSHQAEDGSRFSFTFSLLLIQAVSNVLLGLLCTVMLKENWKTFPLKECWLPGLTFIAAMQFSNEALLYVSYPTQVLAKSCKMVPVLLGNVLIFRRKHTAAEYLQVALVTAGIAMFQWKSSKADGEDGNTPYGLLLLLLSLLMDGLTGPNQDSIIKTRRCSSFQLMAACNAWAIVYMTIALSTFGEGLDGFRYIANTAHSGFLQYIALFALCGALGQVFIYFTITKFG